jgi:replicative DNA helicase
MSEFPISLPHSVDAEKGLLSSMIQSIDVCSECLSQLPESIFFYPAHQHLFGTFSSLFSKNQPLDFLLIKKELSDSKLLEEVGGAEYVNEIWDFVPTAANWKHYAAIVKDNYVRRVTIQECMALTEAMYDPEVEAQGEVSSRVEKTLTKLALDIPRQDRSFKDQILDALYLLEQRRISGDTFSGALFGIKSLDQAICGVRPGDLCIVAAETSGGKTALALSAIKYTAAIKKRPVAVFSLEMPCAQLIERMFASEAHVSMRSLRSGLLSDREFQKLTGAQAVLNDCHIFIDDSSYGDIGKIVSECRRLRTKHGLELVVVDYLQLIDSPFVRKESNREREVANISRQLKNMAKELQIPVIALSQLNEEGKLRESRAIGQDADIVLKIGFPDSNDDSFAREIFIEKQRNGPRGESIPVRFDGEYMRFEDASFLSAK